MTKLLITSAGTSTALNFVQAMQQSAQVDIVSCDINPAHLVPATRLGAIRHYQVPLASQTHAYLDAITKIVRDEDIDAIYPIHDLEILTLLEADLPALRSVRLPAHDAGRSAACFDKWSAFVQGMSAGLPMARTWLGNAAQEIPADLFPTFAKPRQGVGSVGVAWLADPGRASNLPDPERMVIQEPCSKPELTIDALRLASGQTLALARERLETKAGVCTKARIFQDQEITALAQRTGEAFGLRGLYCFQLMHGKDQAWRITDINPRCGGGSSMSRSAGFPLYELFVADWLEQQDLAHWREQAERALATMGEVNICRVYQDIITTGVTA